MLVNSCAKQHPAVAADGKRVKTSDPLDHLADPGTTSPEDMALLADCSEEVKERLRMMARRGAEAARRLTNAERNRQQSRVGAEPWSRQVTAALACEASQYHGYSLAAKDGRALIESRLLRRRARLSPLLSPCSTEGKSEFFGANSKERQSGIWKQISRMSSEI